MTPSNQPTEIDVTLYTRPFDDILPWLGGLMRLPQENEAEQFGEKTRQYLYPPNTLVPSFPKLAPIDYINSPQIFRIIEIIEGDPFCVIEASHGATDFFSPVVDAIQRFARCAQVAFLSSYIQATGDLSYRSVRVSRKNETIRSVLVDHEVDSDGNEGTRPWLFEVSGEAQAWEDPNQYESRRIKDRLTEDLLKIYMLEFGLDYQHFQKRRFCRVIDFRDATHMPGLIEKELTEYDGEAIIVKNWLEEKIFEFSSVD